MDGNSLLWGLLFGSIGFVYFSYGKKRKRIPFMVAGAALIVFPYAVSNITLMVLIGLVLFIAPILMRE